MAGLLIARQDEFRARLETGALVVSGPDADGRVAQVRLPTDLERLGQWLAFIQQAGDALAERMALAERTGGSGAW